MGIQRGKDLLLKVDMDGNGSFSTVAGMRANKIAFNAQSIDTTNADSNGAWRELLDGAGIKQASISGSGIFKDTPSDETVRGIFFGGIIRNWKVILPDFGIVTGNFQITSLEYSGNYNNEINYEISIESAGELSFETL